jgi:mannose-6-phosphate isomerase-like protein (cupin superfamily)
MKLSKHVPELHAKGWGSELWLYNGPEYCGKLLQFKIGAKFSLHFHAMKKETWHVMAGKFDLLLVDTTTAKSYHLTLAAGDAVTIPPLTPHQLTCLEAGTILEVSSQHFDSDSYRIAPGDSQNK